MIEPIKEPPIKRIFNKIVIKQDRYYKLYNNTQDIFIKENKQCQMNKTI